MPTCVFSSSQTFLPPLQWLESASRNWWACFGDVCRNFTGNICRIPRTCTVFIILSLAGRKILLYPERERKCKKELESIEKQIKQAFLVARSEAYSWMKPIFLTLWSSHSGEGKPFTWNLAPDWGRSLQGKDLDQSTSEGWNILLTSNAVCGWNLAHEFLPH